MQEPLVASKQEQEDVPECKPLINCSKSIHKFHTIIYNCDIHISHNKWIRYLQPYPPKNFANRFPEASVEVKRYN